MKRIKYYTYDKRYIGDFKPIYGNANPLFWVGLWISEFLMNFFLDIFLWFEDRTYD
jgi:hypothetical protein